jgi:hypothetical protein
LLNIILNIINPACLDGVHNQFRGIGNLHFSEDIFTMGIDGMVTDVFSDGNLLGC